MQSDRDEVHQEVDKIVELLQSWIKQARENNEYKTIANYISGNKLKSVNNFCLIDFLALSP